MRFLRGSMRLRIILEGFLYYDGDHDVIHRKRTMIGEDGKLEVVENLPNNRIVDNQYAKMVATIRFPYSSITTVSPGNIISFNFLFSSVTNHLVQQ